MGAVEKDVEILYNKQSQYKKENTSSQEEEQKCSKNLKWTWQAVRSS
jgi:hypothetical protein